MAGRWPGILVLVFQLAAGCAAPVPSDPAQGENPRTKRESAQEIAPRPTAKLVPSPVLPAGLTTRLMPLRVRHVIGEPMPFSLQARNDGEAPVEYTCPPLLAGTDFLVTGPDGKPVPCVDQHLGILCRMAPNPMLISQGRTALLFRRLPLAHAFWIAAPGRYTVRFLGAPLGQTLFPPSNEVPFDVEPGELRPADRIVGRLLPILPDGWSLYRSGRRKLAPNGRERATGAWFSLWCPAARITVWQMERRVKNADPPRWWERGVSECLGESGLGHFYVLIPDKAKVLWPDARERIAGALEIRRE